MNDFAAAAEQMKRDQSALSPFAAAAEEMKRRQSGTVGMSLAYDERNPDDAAKSLSVGKELGVSPLIVDGEPEAYDARLRMKRAAETLRDAPKTAAWLSDMGNGVLAKDDLENLSWWERGLRGFADIGAQDNPAAAIGRAVGRGVRRIPVAGDVMAAQSAASKISDAGRSFDELVAEELAQVGGEKAPAQMRVAAIEAARLRFEAARGLTKSDVEKLTSAGAVALKSAQDKLDAIGNVKMSGAATDFRDKTLANSDNTVLGVLGAFASDPLGGAAFVAETAAEFVPMMAAASVVTATTRSPAAGAVTMGGTSALVESTSSAMDFLAEQGVSLETPEDAAAVLQNAELMQAARDRGLSRGVVIGAMDALSGGVAGKTLARTPIGDMIAQGIAQVAFGAGGEGLGQLAAGQQISWKDIVLEGLAEIATAPIEVLGVGGRGLIKRSVNAARSGDTAASLSSAESQAIASKLRERAPEKFKEALDAQGLGDQAVFVPADALREYFQAKDLSDETLLAWGIDPATFEEAAQSGNDVAIPMSNYAAYIAGTDNAKWFAENATTDPDEMSLAAAKAFNASVNDIMEQAFYEAERARKNDMEERAADVQIYDQVFSQLRQAGRSPDVAKNEASVWAAFWRTMGERYQEDPLALARSMGVDIRGPQSDEFRRRDTLDIALNTLRSQGEKALKPKGLSLAEFVKAKGGVQDVGGDVAAMEPPKGVVAETAKQVRDRANQPTLDAMPSTGAGLTLDEMGRMAAEAGYFPDLLGEVNIGIKGEATDFAARLLAALSEDVAGRKAYAEGEGPDANLQALSDALSERGLDPATMTNDEIVAALEATDGSTLNQGQDKPLYVVHNLSAENLRHALDLGGLAAPSLAIARGDIGMDSFGEISLIGDPSMADPKGRGVKAFNADVYSPRQPRAQYDINGKPFRAMMEVLGDAASALQESPQGNIDPDRVSREGLSALENQDVVKMAYLMDIGDAPKVIYKKTEPIPAAMKKWVGKPRWEIAADPEFIAALKDDIERQIAALPDDLKEGAHEAITNRKLPGGQPPRFMVEEKARALAEATGKRKVDSYETGRAIRKRMGKTKAREGQFRSWLEEKFGDVLGAKFFTNDAGRRKPYEIDAIVREMTRTIRDGEGWNYGVGSIRSTVAQQFKTIKQIQASRDKVIDSAAMDKLKEEASDELVALADKFAPYHASSGDFGWLDIFSEFLKDLSRGRLREWQTSIFDKAAPPELIAEARAYLGKLSDMPTEYFEIKMQRAVGLDEFKAALVPSDASSDTVKALKDAGLEVVKYKRDNEGRGRTEALQKLGEKVFFQSAPLKTDTPEFRAWFGDSKVVDENGDPLVVYHGTQKSGFGTFNVDGRGKTAGTGAFFTESVRGAMTYSGTKAEFRPVSVEMIVADPEGFGFEVVEDEGEWIATDPNGNEYASRDREQAIIEVANDWLKQAGTESGNYAVYLSITNPLVIDAEGANWNSIGGTDDYFVQNEDGEVVEYFTNQEDADWFATLNEDEMGPLEVVKERNSDFAASTDDMVRQAREDGYDGVIFENITDEGPFGQGYGWDNKVYVAFRPEQIKSVYNRGTFDPNDPRILYQPAWHGSPHIFDRFSTGFMGTGEGAQAFGWGMYFAGRKGVAKFYRDKLSIGPRLILDGEAVGSGYIGHKLAEHIKAKVPPKDTDFASGFDTYSAYLQWMKLDAVYAMGRLESGSGIWTPRQAFEAVWGAREKSDPPYPDEAGSVEKMKAAALDFFDSVSAEKPGRLYKVDIPEDSDLLAWDEPLSEQSEKVRESLKKIGTLRKGMTGEEFYRELMDVHRSKAYSDGQKLTQEMAASGEGWTPENIAKNAEIESRYQNPDRAASLALRDAGIPGHRFLDGGSRGDGEGSYNYVIYDDAAVSIMEFEQLNRGSIVLPSGGLGNGQTVINLFEAADLSTFIHESGHFFLEAFNALASDASAPQGMKDDRATIMEWLGVKEWSEIGVKQHEQWARGFEAYAMEGKAPSLALADAFSRFKAWLTRIYKTALGLNVKITPEIREVMDRMLATDAEIAAARQEQEMGPLFADAPPGMSEGDFATYRRMARRATESAEQALLEKTMAKVRREKEAWFREEKSATRAEVAASIDREPRYRLIDMLANQVWVGADADAVIPDMQIDRKMLVEQFGEGVIAELSRQRFGGKRAIYGDNGASPQEVAEFFGFKSASEMISVLQNTPKKRDAIAAEVDRRMTERHGDPLNDGSIEEEALAAIHNEQQANTAVAEARHLAKQLGRSTSNMTAKLYRQRARAMVGRMSVRDATRPERFLASERKAARAAQDAFAKVARGTGKADAALAEALQAKEQQILNGFLYDEARQVAKEVQKGREKMRAYDKKSIREKLEGGYIEQIDAILADYDFRVRGVGQIARTESLKAFIDRMEAEGRAGDLNIDERLIDAANRKHYSKLSVDELRGLFDTIDNIDHMGRFKQKLIDRKRARDLQASAATVAGQIKQNLGTGKSGEKSKIAAAFNLLWRTDTLLIRMDGGQEIGSSYDEIKRPIDEAVSEEQKMHVEMAERLDRLFSDHYSDADLRKMKVEREISGSNGRPWSKMEILAVAMNVGNEDNFARLTAKDAAVQNRLTPDQVNSLLATMDENDWRFVQDMWDMVNSYWGGLAEVHKRRTGVVPKKVEAKMMVDAPAFVSGGYYPIKYDPALSAAAATDEASAWDKFTATGHGATAAIRNGMTKQRQKSGGGRTLRLDLSVSFAHMRDTIRYIALSEVVDNAYRIISRPEVQNAFLDAGARDQHDILRLWLKDVASGPAPSPDAINTMSRILKNNFTLSRLALNFKTVALQVTGVGQSAAVIGKKNMVRGYIEYLQNPRGTAASVVEKSAFMRERQSTFQKDIYDFMDDTQIAGPLSSRYKKAKSTLAKIGFAPIVWTQFWGVDMPTWLGAFRSGIEKYGGEDKAITYADRMVARAQDSGLMSDRAAFERGTVSEAQRQSDFIRLFTTLGGYMLTKMNRAYVTSMQAKANFRDADTGAQRVAVALNAATDLAMLYVTEAAITGIVYALMADDEDDEDIAKFLLTETGSALVGGMPFIRDAYSGLMGYGGGGIYGTLSEAPSNFIRQVAQGENDTALRRSIADMIGMVTGLPTTGPMRAIEGGLSEDVPLSEAIFGRNPLAR